jgi:putative Mg2+ transporter-C (MgtC) family protein
MDQPILVELCGRLGVALLIGVVIGVERHLHDQAAGLRTHVLVALAAALSVLVVAPPGTIASGALDAQSRVLQGVMTGVGFIGAGVIMHSPKGHKIHGLTTAAAIWITAAFGALCGAGRFQIAACGLVAVVLVLAVGGPIERSIHRRFGRIHDGESIDELPAQSDEPDNRDDRPAR